MKYEEIVDLIGKYKKGQFFSITFSKQLPVCKNFKGFHEVKKVSNAIVRIGVKYDNIKAVAEKRVTGELPKENSGLPWGEWDIPGYTIKHNGKIYLRVSLVNGNKIRSDYYVDSLSVDEGIAKGYCLASAFRTSEGKPDVLTINIENIERVR